MKKPLGIFFGAGALILILLLFAAGCLSPAGPRPSSGQPGAVSLANSAAPGAPQTPGGNPAAVNSLPPEETALRVLSSFLQGNFRTAEPLFTFSQPGAAAASAEKNFAAFSRHIRQRMELDAKASGSPNADYTVKISNPQAISDGIMLAEASISWANGQKTLHIPMKLTKTPRGWMVPYEDFMLSVVDALDDL